MSDELIELKGCGSHSCAVSPHVGVGNNGPCRCMVSDYRGQSLVRSMQNRVAELEDACANWLDRELKAIERGNRLDAALAEAIEWDWMTAPEDIPQHVIQQIDKARAGE